MSLNKYLSLLVCVGALSFPHLVKAAAPVEDIGGGSMSMQQPEGATTYPAGDDNMAYVNSTPAPAQPQAPALNLSDAQRLTRAEQQISNLMSMNLPQQLADLQQQMQQLNGQLQELQHQLKTLSDQQTSFYQDLDQRINQLKGGAVKSKLSSSAVSSMAAAAKATPMTADAKIKESDEYQAAVNWLMKKNYAKAGPAFKAYIAHYPQGSYIANAYYWLGEVNLMSKNLSQAAKAFQTVISKYPKSDKIADARLKLAMVHAQQGSIPMAKAELKKIKADYPGSTIAQLATIQLQQLDATALNSN